MTVSVGLAAAVLSSALLSAPGSRADSHAPGDPGRELMNQMVDASGEALGGARMTVYPMPSQQRMLRMDAGDSFVIRPIASTRTAQNGAFSLPAQAITRADAREYRVQVERPGSLPAGFYVSAAQLRAATDSAATWQAPDLRPLPPGAHMPTAASRSRIIKYRLLREVKRNTTVGLMRSRARNGKVGMTFTSSGQASIAVGVRLDYQGLVGFDTSTRRTLTSGIVVPFKPMRGVGTLLARTSVVYKKWRLKEFYTASCVIRVGCRTGKRRWTEIRPEGINGGDASLVTRNRPLKPPNPVWCGARIQPRHSNTIFRGAADEISAAVNVFGVTLSAQSGYTQEVSVQVGARKRPVRACGYGGPVADDAGSVVAVAYRGRRGR